MIEPERHRPRLAKPEQRMVVRRGDQIVALNRPLEPEALLLPGIERQAAQLIGTIETVGNADVVSGYMATRRDDRKRVLAALTARQSREDAALTLSCSQRVVQIRLQHRVRADL